MPFSGNLRVRIVEALDLKPTDFAVRHPGLGKGQQMLIDPYVNISVDDNYIDRSSTKQRTFKPVWNENFSANVIEAQNLSLTVFHDAAIPPDEFVANCILSFDELLSAESRNGVYESDFWVSFLLSYFSSIQLS